MLPDSIPESLWAEFRLMRKKIKHPMTDYAEQLILRKLEKWRVENGANVVAILNESIERGWSGVFLNGHGAKLGQVANPETLQDLRKPASPANCASCGRSLEAGFIHSRKGRVCGNC
jgi:hypothetical protein